MAIFQKLLTIHKRFLLLMLSLVCCYTSQAIAEEVLLYDSTGQYVGFVDPTVDSIYLPSGEPVAYIDKTTGTVYGYNGTYLGWYNDGVIRDTNGYIIGFAAHNAPKMVQIKTPTNVQFVRKTVPTRPAQVIRVETRPTFINELSPTPFRSIYVY